MTSFPHSDTQVVDVTESTRNNQQLTLRNPNHLNNKKCATGIKKMMRNIRINKKQNPYFKPIVSTGLIVLIIILFAAVQLLSTFAPSSPPAHDMEPIPYNNPQQFSTATTTTTNTSHFSQTTISTELMFLADDEPGCNDVTTYTGDRCEFVKLHCTENESLLNYMRFSYCVFSPHKPIHKVMILAVFAVLLVLLLMILSSSADVWLVPSLTVIATELKLSPAVAGATLLSLANGAPDIITSLTSLRQGAEDGEVGLVLGSLSGATMCISCLILGFSLIAAENKTAISKSSFLRNMSGLVLVVITIGLCWKGTIRYWDGIIIICLYFCYLIGSVVLLQKQEARKRNERQASRRQAFLSTTMSYRQLFPDFEKKSTSNKDPESHQGLLSNSADNECPAESQTNFLNPTPVRKLSFGTATFSKSPSSLGALGNSDNILLDDLSPSSRGSSQLAINQLDSDPETPSGANDPAAVGSDDDDDDDDVDQTYFMEGLFPDPSWKKIDESSGKRDQNFFKRNILRVIWFVLWPFFLLRWLSIPATDHRPDYLRGPKKLALHISPLFAPFVIFLFLGGIDGSKIYPTIAAVTLVILSNLFYFFIVMPSVSRYDKERAEVQLYVDSTRDQSGLTEEELHKVSDLVLKYHLDGGDRNESAKPFFMTLYMSFISLLAFCSSVAWLGLAANEIVEVLSTLGTIFSISPTFLGLSVLAIGNSIPDGASDITLAKKGHMAIAYSAIWSAPVLSNTFGLGLAILLATAKVPVISYTISTQLILCWVSVLVAIVVTVVGFLVVYKRQPPSQFGYVLCALYGAFIVAAIVVEVFKL